MHRYRSRKFLIICHRMKEEVLVEEKEKEMSRLKKAFGIKRDHVEGRGFNFETEKQREERLARIVAEEQRQSKKKK